MKRMRKAIALLLIWTLAISPVMEAMAQNDLSKKPETKPIDRQDLEKVVTLLKILIQPHPRKPRDPLLPCLTLKKRKF